MAFLIADGLVLAVLLIFACIGARRGLILSLCGLLAFVVAFLGASFAARTLSPVVADALEPKFAAAIEEQLNESIRQQAEAGEAAVLSPDDVPLEGVLDALREMGFYETLINTVDRAVESGMTAVAASAAAAVAAAIAQSAAYLILFLLGFFLILLARPPLSQQDRRRPVRTGAGLHHPLRGRLAAPVLRADAAPGAGGTDRAPEILHDHYPLLPPGVIHISIPMKIR